PCPSVPVLVVDAALTAQRHLVPSGGWPSIDWPAMLKLAARDSEHRSPVVRAEILTALDEIAERNNVSQVWREIRSGVIYRGLPELQRPGWDVNGHSFVVDGAELQLRTVVDAALFVALAIEHSGTISSKVGMDGRMRAASLPTHLGAEARNIWIEALSQIERRPSSNRMGRSKFWSTN